MKNLVLLITLTTILVSCNFNSKRKSEISQRINFLEKQLDRRIIQKDRLNERLNSASRKFQPLKTGTESEFMTKISVFDSIIKPIMIQLNELEALDKVDHLEISKLRQEYAQL